jgi:proton glutamate symport protein
MTTQPSSRFSLSLAQQIFLGMFIGGMIGWLQPQWGSSLFFLRDIFLNLIKSIIAPLVFSTIVVGIAGSGSARNVGRMGLRSLLYFEIVTTLALVIGLVVVNITQPGVGIQLNGTSDAVQTIAQTQPKTLIQTLVHVFPSSIVDALLRGDVLQIVAFSILFGFGISAVGEAAAPLVRVCESLAQVMFRFTEIVMMFAPIGIGAAMAHTIGHQGLGILVNLGVLIGSLYAALVIFVVLVLGSVAWIVKLPVKPFLRAVREPFMLAFVTTSSESALPKAMENMERFGVPKRIVGFVMPT